MTKQPPRELSELMQEFEIEIPLKHRTKFRELCNISTEKIKRLEAALEQCKDQRDWWVHEKYEGAETKDIDALVEQENARLESILEGR